MTLRKIEVNGPIEKPHFVLVYGGSGTGKTHLCGTLGELGSVLVIDIDTGYDTLATAKKLTKARDNIDIVSFDSFKDLDAAYKLVKKNDPAAWDAAFQLPAGHTKAPYDWIVWDTWSEIQFVMMEQLRKEQGGGMEFSNTLAYRKNVQLQHWGMLTDLNKLAIEELRKCKVNQVFTMQEQLMRDKLSESVYGGPAIHGKLVQEIPAYFSIVAHTSTDLQGNFMATTRSKGKWPAKTRRGEGADFKDPTMKQVLGV